jgi:hypothetical protein
MQMYGVNSVSDMQIILIRHGARIHLLGLVMGLMILLVLIFLFNWRNQNETRYKRSLE